MANTYKNVVITPNRSSNSDDPKITFSGANTTSNTDITLRMYPTSNGTLSFEGSAGQLFSITNDLTGTIYSVNDVSGIPSIAVYANGQIDMARYSGNLFFGTTSSNSSSAFLYSNLRAGHSTLNSSPASTPFSHTFAALGSNRVVNFDGVGTTPSVWWTNGSRAYGAIDAQDPGLTIWSNNGSAWQQQMAINYGNVTINTDIRSPIFYDSNDTGYWIDPAANPSAYFANDIYIGKSSSDYVRINYDQIWRPNGGQLHLQYSAGGNIHMCQGGGYALSVTSFRSPIFYDNDNTGYYTDPASTSNLYGLTVNQTITGSVSGNAGTAGGLSVHSGTNNEANKIVRTDGSGYIQAGWINTISGNLGSGSRLDRVFCSNDQYVRYLSLTEFKMQMGLSAKNNYQRYADYTSDTNYWVGSMGGSGYGANETFHGGSGFFDIWSGTNYPSGQSHIHGFNALHYTTNSLGSTGGNAYGWQMAAQYSSTGRFWVRMVSGGSFSSWYESAQYGVNPGGVLYADTFYDSNTSYYLDPSASTSINVAGAIQAGGNITAYYSDERLKTKLGYIDQPLNKLMSITAFYYEANQTAQKLGYKPKREVGLSAQEIQNILPEIVAPAPLDNNYLTIDYARVVPLLVEAIKELNQKHETEIAELKQALAALLNKQ